MPNDMLRTRLSRLTTDGRLTIESFGPGRFRLGGETMQGGLLLTAGGWSAWPVSQLDDIDVVDLVRRVTALGGADVLLIGCGARLIRSPAALVAVLRAAGQKGDVMATDAACRSFNLMVAEGRRVAAALIPLPAPGQASGKEKAEPEGSA